MIEGPKGTIPTRLGWVDIKTRRIITRVELSPEFIADWKNRNIEFVNEYERKQEEKRQALAKAEPVRLVQDLVREEQQKETNVEILETDLTAPQPDETPKKRRTRKKKVDNPTEE